MRPEQVAEEHLDQGLRPVQTLHINNGILSGIDRSRIPLSRCVPLQLLQYGFGRLGEHWHASQVCVYQEENSEQHEHEENS